LLGLCLYEVSRSCGPTTLIVIVLDVSLELMQQKDKKKEGKICLCISLIRSSNCEIGKTNQDEEQGVKVKNCIHVIVDTKLRDEQTGYFGILL
jgi:hypothetical protein